MIEAADYFLRKQNRSLGISEAEKIKIAVKSLGLDDLKPFDPEQKIIEYILEGKDTKRLIDLSAIGLAEETASESMAPGGGSISAYVGALGVSLGTMVANLSGHKAGWDERWEEFSDWAVKGQQYKNKLLYLVDEDTNSFNKIIEAFRLPKTTDQEKTDRTHAIQEATKYATEIPFQVMQTARDSMEVMEAMLKDGLQSSLSDAGVGMLCARTAVIGAYYNVRINAKDIKDKDFASDILSRAEKVYTDALEREARVMAHIDTLI
jgi:glutamate formiminotransferase/formiminotetrahydrofolate cyclodeaminase